MPPERRSAPSRNGSPGLPGSCAVALPLPAATPYTYEVPGALADRVRPGARVVVPVRSRTMVGVVVDVESGKTDDLKPVFLAPDPTPLLTPELLDVARWIARYYGTPIGLTLKAMLPATLWGTSQLTATVRDPDLAAGGAASGVMSALRAAGGRATATSLAKATKRPVWSALQRLERAGAVTLVTTPPRLGPQPATERVIRLSRDLPSLLERDEVFGRAHRQREIYEAIDALGGEVTQRHLTTHLGFSGRLAKILVDRGLAELVHRKTTRDPFAGVSATPPATPTPDQRAALDRLRTVPEGGAAILFGVTGSGKTLVYLEAMREAVTGGRGAIVLVPEIALTPQTIARVRGVFGDAVAVLHSGLSDAERADAWRALASGERRVAVGARSAVFAPVRDLATIVVDEEHDASYKNGEQPRYHARDVALRRAKGAGARVILGSATPSIETWAARDRVPVVALPQRATAQPLPPVSLVDLRSATRVPAAGPVPWSETLDTAVGEALDRGEQVILLLNRRGFAHFLQCPECGEVAQCPSCSISLTVHRAPDRLRCHYCGFDRRFPSRCDVCESPTRRTRGAGTQLLERWLSERFAEARLARMDADTTGTKWSHQRILDAVARGDVDVLFGTQMIAKGLDFPGVTLVGVIDADTGLYLPDFRAAERTFQLIAQVAGRAGRGPRGGRVLVQTRVPDHYALQYAAKHDFEAFADREIAERHSPPYPPHTGVINVMVSGTDDRAVGLAAVEIADWLRAMAADRRLTIEVVGPAPAPLARLKGRWRWHLVLRSADRGLLGRVLGYAVDRAPYTRRGAIRVVFDRDPIALL